MSQRRSARPVNSWPASKSRKSDQRRTQPRAVGGRPPRRSRRAGRRHENVERQHQIRESFVNLEDASVLIEIGPSCVGDVVRLRRGDRAPGDRPSLLAPLPLCPGGHTPAQAGRRLGCSLRALTLGHRRPCHRTSGAFYSHFRICRPRCSCRARGSWIHSPCWWAARREHAKLSVAPSSSFGRIVCAESTGRKAFVRAPVRYRLAASRRATNRAKYGPFTVDRSSGSNSTSRRGFPSK